MGKEREDSATLSSASTPAAWSKNPYVLMPLLLLMWGSFSATNKLLLGSMDSYSVLFYMYGLALVIFAVVLISQGKLRGLRTWRWKDYALLAGCGTLAFLYDFFYLQALKVLPATEASMLNYLFPIFIVLFAIPLHGERFTWPKAASIGLGFAGTLLLVTKGDWSSLTLTNIKGDVLAILAAICWGLFSNLVKFNRRDAALSNGFLTFIAFGWSIGAGLGFAGDAAGGASTLVTAFTIPSLSHFGGLVWLAVSNIVLGFFLYFRALKYTSASLVASFTYFTPCVTLVFIMVLLGERLVWIDLPAFLLIFLSVPVQSVLPRFHRKGRAAAGQDFKEI